MHTPVRILAVSIAALASAALSAQPSVVTDRSTLSPGVRQILKLAKDSTLEIKGLGADVTVVKASGPDASIAFDAVPGKGPDPRVELLTHDSGVTVCAVYPSPNQKKPNECVPGTKGRLTEGVKKDFPRVRFQVALPDDVHLRADVIWGEIKVNAGTSNLDVRTLVGNISITDHGSRTIDAATSAQGDLVATIAPVSYPERRTIGLKVVMGELRVAIPPRAYVNYRIFTERTVDTPFKLAKPIGSSRHGELNPGGSPAIDLNLDATMLLGRFVLEPSTK